eukprot:Pgem_evm1s8293
MFIVNQLATYSLLVVTAMGSYIENPKIKNINCGNHFASHCELCPHGITSSTSGTVGAFYQNGVNAKNLCNGDCTFNENKNLCENASVERPKIINCGGHLAGSCMECAYDVRVIKWMNGVHAKNICNGDCKFSDNTGACVGNEHVDNAPILQSYPTRTYNNVFTPGVVCDEIAGCSKSCSFGTSGEFSPTYKLQNDLCIAVSSN